MKTKGWTLLRILLSHSNDELSDSSFQDTFLSDLSESAAKDILAIKPPGSQIDALLNLPSEIFGTIHYSWLAETVKKITPSLQSQVVSLCEPKQAKKLSKLLGITPLEQPLSKPVRSFLTHTLFEAFNAENILPKAFLPKGDLTALAKLSKQELVELIDLLGIFDLVDESRTILDNKKIKAINSCLSPIQHRFSIFCLHQREKIASSRLNLSNWNGDCNELQKMIHIRGIARLGKALSGQNRHLIWYISHTLDSGRGKLLEKHVEKEPIVKITPALSQQVLQTLNHLQKKSKSS